MSGFKFDNRTGVVEFNSAPVIDASVGVVSSVNSLTGAVVLSAADVSAYTTTQTDALLGSKVDASALAPVATSGAYTSLTGTPTLAAVATSGAYTDLSGKPVLSTVATSGAYADLSGKPTLATVATSGAYGDLTGTPTLAAVATSGAYADLTGKPVLSTVATSGAYADLSGKPSFGVTATYYVQKNGNDSTGTGSFDKPFLTPQAAHDYAVTAEAATTSVVIVVMPGAYPAVNITRPRTSFVGLTGQNFSTMLGAVRIQNDVQISGATDNTQYTFENISISASSTQNCLELTGTVAATLILTNVRIYTNIDVGGRRGVYVHSTDSARSKVRLFNVDINTKASGGASMEFSNTQGFLTNVLADAGSGLTLAMYSGCDLTLTNSNLETNGAALMAVGQDSRAIVLYTTLRNNMTDSDLVVLQSNGLMLAASVLFVSDGVNGNVITGSSSNVVQYGVVNFGPAAGGTFTTKVAPGVVKIAAANAFT